METQHKTNISNREWNPVVLLFNNSRGDKPLLDIYWLTVRTAIVIGAYFPGISSHLVCSIYEDRTPQSFKCQLDGSFPEYFLHKALVAKL